MAMKTLYVVKHNSGSYLESLARKKFTTVLTKAFRASTIPEAEEWITKLAVPIAWKVVAVEYDTYQGKATRELTDDPPVAAGVVCVCPSSFCPIHGKLNQSELRAGRRVRD